MGLFPNGCKHLPMTTIYYNNKVTSKVKDLKKRSNEKILLSLQPDSTKYNKPFKFVLWLNFLEEHHVLSSDIWGKTISHWLDML